MGVEIIHEQHCKCRLAFLLTLQLSVYLGWKTVATVANVTDWLYIVNWNGFGIAAQTWTVIMIAVASLIGLAMAITGKDAAYLFVLAWSFVGIAVKQTPAPDEDRFSC